MPDNSPAATGEPVTAAEVVGHWFKLVGQGEPEIDVRPIVVEAVVSALADQLLAQLPELSDTRPLYIHVSDVLDAGAAADLTAGAYVDLDLPASQHVPPVEQPDGSLLFESSDLMRLFKNGMPNACEVEDDGPDWDGGLVIDGIPVSDLTVRLWLYRVAGDDQMRCRVSVAASVAVPVVGDVQAQVTLDGIAYVSEGPEADGLVPGDFYEDDWWE